jgi:hypothetical protein
VINPRINTVPTTTISADKIAPLSQPENLFHISLTIVKAP